MLTSSLEGETAETLRTALYVVTGLLLWLFIGSAAEHFPKYQEPALTSQMTEASVASGLSLAVLGGFRAPASSLIFLEGHLAWQRRDLKRTEGLLSLALEVDPRPIEYWLRASRIIALDFPHWRFAEIKASGSEITPVIERQTRLVFLRQGLEWLDRASAQMPDRADIPLEKARLWLTVFQDRKEALFALEIAVRLPNAPFFAHRLYADLLDATGQTAKALEHLEAHFASLPPREQNPDAQHDYVAARITELREKLRED